MLTTADLLDSIKRGASVPTYQPRFSNADLLALANEELESRLLPLIKSLRADYFLFQESQLVVSSQNSYQIPHRSIGGNILDLTYTSGDQTRSLRLIDPSEALSSVSSEPNSFYFYQDSVILYPTPNQSATITFTYELAPAKLVTVEEAVLISSLTSTSIDSASIPSTFTANTQVDFLKAKGSNATLQLEQPITNTSSTTLDFASIPSQLSVGDYVCLSGESCLLQVPKELRSALSLAVQVRVFDALGDSESSQITERKLQEKLNQAKTLLTPRVKYESQAIVGKLGGRGGKRMWWCP